MEYKIIKLNSARNCLRYIIRAFEIDEIYIPYYLCSCIRHSILKEDCKIHFYHIDEKFMPVCDFREDDFILYPNYWGICSEIAEKLAFQYKNLIVDNAHSFYSKPLGIASFNSVRKFFPKLRDGAVLYSSKVFDSYFKTDEFDYEMKELDYNEIIKNEKRIDNSDIKIISNCTANLFDEIDLEKEKQKKLSNFYGWHEQLKNSNSLKINLRKDEVPFCYPYLAKTENDADTLVKELENKGIMIYRYWENLPESFSESIFQKQLVAIPIY